MEVGPRKRRGPPAEKLGSRVCRDEQVFRLTYYSSGASLCVAQRTSARPHLCTGHTDAHQRRFGSVATRHQHSHSLVAGSQCSYRPGTVLPSHQCAYRSSRCHCTRNSRGTATRLCHRCTWLYTDISRPQRMACTMVAPLRMPGVAS
jgi:hypothetical protein